MKLLRAICVALLAAWPSGCASTVNSSAADAASVDARPDAPSDAVDDAADAPDVEAGASAIERGSLAVSGVHACALDGHGGVRCWGNNDYGQLGDGTTERRLTPVPVNGIDGAALIAVGQAATCAVLRDRTVRCWGLSPTRSVEPRPPIPRDALILSPATVANLDQVQSMEVYAGPSGLLSCAIRADASVWCWGRVENVPGYPVGQRAASPMGPATLADVAVLRFEALTRCVVARSGTAACWGWRSWDSAYPFSDTPVAIEGVADAREVAVDETHLCVLSRHGTVACMGSNDYGQLGDGTTNTSLRRLVAVRGLTDAVSIASHGLGTVALRADGTVVTWGHFTASRRALAPVPGLQRIVDVAAGLNTFCARRADGAVFCWGDNSRGLLGNDSPRGSDDPVRIPGLGP